MLWNQPETKPMAELGDDQGVSVSTDFSNLLTLPEWVHVNVDYTTTSNIVVVVHSSFVHSSFLQNWMITGTAHCLC